MSRKFIAFLITVLIIVLLSLFGVGITYILRITNIDSNVRGFLERTEVVSYTTVTTIVSSPVSDLDQVLDTITPIDLATSKLTSEVLKLSFNYQITLDNYPVITSKKGNKITIKSANQSENDAQFIELYTKKTDETFSEAVRRIFLDGVPENFCFFRADGSAYSFDNKSFAFGSINAGTGVRTEQCPSPYTNDEGEGKRFFIYDPNFPDRFGFVFVGNTFVPGTAKSTNWFQSLQFIQ